MRTTTCNKKTAERKKLRSASKRAANAELVYEALTDSWLTLKELKGLGLSCTELHDGLPVLLKQGRAELQKTKGFPAGYRRVRNSDWLQGFTVVGSGRPARIPARSEETTWEQ